MFELHLVVLFVTRFLIIGFLFVLIIEKSLLRAKYLAYVLQGLTFILAKDLAVGIQIDSLGLAVGECLIRLVLL